MWSLRGQLKQELVRPGVQVWTCRGGPVRSVEAGPGALWGGISWFHPFCVLVLSFPPSTLPPVSDETRAGSHKPTRTVSWWTAAFLWTVPELFLYLCQTRVLNIGSCFCTRPLWPSLCDPLTLWCVFYCHYFTEFPMMPRTVTAGLKDGGGPVH